MNFDAAFTKLLGFEGDFSNDKDDPGGATRYGITETVARANGYSGPMRELPLDFAKAVYKRFYWDAVQADSLPPAVRYAVFDAAVNSGPKQATLWLQRALGVKDDGAIGPRTLKALSEQHPDGLLRRFLGQRLVFMTSLPNWPTFSKGWARRVGDLLLS